MVAQVGPGLLRFGGNSVDKLTGWLRGPRTPSTPSSVIAASDVDRAFAFARAVGWRVLFSLNLGQGDPATDADEADYVYRSASDVLSGFEIGNEPDLYHSNGLRPSTYTVNDYMAEWRTYANAIQSQGPRRGADGLGGSGVHHHLDHHVCEPVGIADCASDAAPLPAGAHQCGEFHRLQRGVHPPHPGQHGAPDRGHRWLPASADRAGAEDPLAHGRDQLLLQRRREGRERCIRLRALGRGLHVHAGRAQCGGRQFPRRGHGHLHAHRRDHHPSHRPAAILRAAAVPCRGARPRGPGDRIHERGQPDRLRRPG